MIICSFYKGERLSLGMKMDKGILDVEEAVARFSPGKSMPENMLQVISQGEDSKQGLSRLIEMSYSDDSLFMDEDSVPFGPCVPKPGKIIGIGLNYKKHADECNLPYPETPVVFSKFHNALAAHKENIELPPNSSQVDYEGELAIVIGKKAKNIKKEDALSIVYGYSIANDLSARDLQNKNSQWLLGKSCDGFCPIGPYLVSKDEIGNPNKLQIRTYLNGEIRQDSNTSDMIFSCEELISYLSNHFTLEPGDVILTGTPAGVILGYPENERTWLKKGVTVTITIDKLGILQNTFK